MLQYITLGVTSVREWIIESKPLKLAKLEYQKLDFLWSDLSKTTT